MKEALYKSEIPPSQIFVIRQLQDRHFDPVWHTHSEFQLFVVLEGTGTRFIGDSIKAFKPGELIFTGPHLPHLWRSDEAYFSKQSQLTSAGIVIYFNENFLGDHILDKEEMTALKKLFSKAMRGIEYGGKDKETIIGMMQQLSTMHGIQRVIMLLELLAFMAVARDYAYISSKPYNDAFNQDESNRINMVYDFVLKHFRRKISLEEIAGILHMTPTSFSRYFTMKNNKPFSKFLSEIRIKHACKLLTETDDPVSHVCYECGFNTLSNFNTQFKAVMLKTPIEYKKEFLSI